MKSDLMKYESNHDHIEEENLPVKSQNLKVVCARGQRNVNESK
jgi:hypothetical protein